MGAIWAVEIQPQMRIADEIFAQKVVILGPWDLGILGSWDPTMGASWPLKSDHKSALRWKSFNKK